MEKVPALKPFCITGLIIHTVHRQISPPYYLLWSHNDWFEPGRYWILLLGYFLILC
jgi:hypothetical protein